MIASAFAVAGLRASSPRSARACSPWPSARLPDPRCRPRVPASRRSSPVSSSAHVGHESAPSRLSTPPPLVSTAGGRSQVLITAATRPLPSAPAPAAQDAPRASRRAPAPAGRRPHRARCSCRRLASSSAPAPGQITLTAMGGTVSWSASGSWSGQVSLSSYGGTLPAGQSVTVTVTVSRGSAAGSATLSFQPHAAAPQVVPVTWSAPPPPVRAVVAPAPVAARPSPSSGSLSGSPSPRPRVLVRPGRPHRPARPRPGLVLAALSWNGDRRAPVAYRAGQARPPDQPRTGPALPGRAQRAGLQVPARAARRDDPVRADHRQARQHGHPDAVRALPHGRGLRRRGPRGAREDHPVDRLLPRQGEQPDRAWGRRSATGSAARCRRG